MGKKKQKTSETYRSIGLKIPTWQRIRNIQTKLSSKDRTYSMNDIIEKILEKYELVE